MTIEDYFGGWYPYVSATMDSLVNDLRELYSRNTCIPEFGQVFKPFNRCDFRDCRVIVIGNCPSINSTGLSIGEYNNEEFKLIMLKSFGTSIDYADKIHSFVSLDKIAEQGILMLNLSLVRTRWMVPTDLFKKMLDIFVDEVSKDRPDITFLLVGDARRYAASVRLNKCRVIESRSIDKPAILGMDKILQWKNGKQYRLNFYSR